MQQELLNWLKVAVKTFITLQNISVSINADILNFLFIKKILKKMYGFYKNIK